MGTPLPSSTTPLLLPTPLPTPSPRCTPTRSPPTPTTTPLLTTTPSPTSTLLSPTTAPVLSRDRTVALPDGRVQHVAYHANDIDGYVAEVTYDGTAVYPEAVPVAVAHA